MTQNYCESNETHAPHVSSVFPHNFCPGIGRPAPELVECKTCSRYHVKGNEKICELSAKNDRGNCWPLRQQDFVGRKGTQYGA